LPQSPARWRNALKFYDEYLKFCKKSMELKFISLLGWITMLAVAWAISYNRKNFPWRTVIWGIGLQFSLALLILHTQTGKDFFVIAGKVVQKLIQFSTDGTKFVFGPLADGDLMGKTFGAEHGLVFGILVTGTVVIVSALSSLFYHWGILQRVVHVVAWVMRKAMGTSGRNAFRRRQYFHGPDRGAAGHPALCSAHDEE